MTIKGTGGLGSRRTSGDHPNYSIVENGQNTEKSSGDLRRLAVTQTLVKIHQLTLIGKILKEKIIIMIIIIIIMHHPAPVLENDTHKLLWDFDIHTDHLISARKLDFIVINKKERTCKIVDFAVPADHRIKLKECKKKDKYLDLARELKKLWNMKVTIVPIVIGAFDTLT